MKIKTDKHLFEIRIVHANRGEWFYVLDQVDGEVVTECGSDLYPNEKEVMRAARRFAKNAYYNPLYGWCN